MDTVFVRYTHHDRMGNLAFFRIYGSILPDDTLNTDMDNPKYLEIILTKAELMAGNHVVQTYTWDEFEMEFDPTNMDMDVIYNLMTRKCGVDSDDETCYDSDTSPVSINYDCD
jgi:hypothetical protein